MMRIDIKRTSDEFECDTCGWDYADGAEVYFDGIKVIDLIPVAHCYSGISYSDEDIFKAILKELGHEVHDN